MSGNRHVVTEIYVLNSIEERRAFLHRTLERLAPTDQAGAARALVDDGGLDGLGEVVVAARAAGANQPGAPHVAVRHLIARQVNRVVARQPGVDALVQLAVGRAAGVERLEAAVVD